MSEKGRVDLGMSADASDVLRKMDQLISKTAKMEQGLGKAHQRSKGFSGSLQGGLEGNVRSLARMASAFLSIHTGINLARRSYQQFQQDVEQGAQKARAFQEEYVNVQFLGMNLDDPKFRQKVLAEAKRTRLTPQEVAKGLTAFQSMTAWATPKQRADMWPELVGLRKTMSASLAEVAPVFTKMGGLYRGTTGREMANISQYMIEQAAVTDPAAIASVAPRMLAAGRIGEIDARTAAAFGAFVTAKTGTPAQASRGMEILMRKVMLKDPDEAEAVRKLAFGQPDPLAGRKSLLKRAGVKGEDNAFSRLQKLSRIKLTPQDMKDLFGERGMSYAKVMLEDPEGLAAMVQDFQVKTAASANLVGDKMAQAMKGDRTFRTIQAIKGHEVATDVAMQKPEWLMLSAVDAALERIRVEQGQHFPVIFGNAVMKYASMMAPGSHRERMLQMLAGALERGGYARTPAEANRMTRDWAGLDVPSGGATGEIDVPQSLFEAAQNLNRATQRAADANSQIETTLIDEP